MSFGAEIVELSDMFFKDHIDYEEEGQEVLEGEQVPEVLDCICKRQLEALEDLCSRAIKAAIKAVQKETGHKGKNLFMPIRVAYNWSNTWTRTSECH